MFGLYAEGEGALKMKYSSALSLFSDDKMKAMVLTYFFISVLGFAIILSPNASAANHECEGKIQPTSWNETFAKHSLVPHYQGEWFFDGRGFNGRGDAVVMEDDMEANDVSTNIDLNINPEERWMYVNPYSAPLDTLTSDHFIQTVVGNDSAGAIRFNLSSTHRTTFCVSLLSNDMSTSPHLIGDVYLMTSSEFQKYQTSYWMEHDSDWYYDDMRDFDDEPSPPEWQNFDITSWKSFRDVHEYENVRETVFSVHLDAPEVYSSIFGETIWDEFYLVIDGWDNSHTNDGQALGQPVYADITVLTTPRSFVLPNWTVALVFFIFCASLIAVPVILNQRYMKAGLQERQDQTFVPTVTKQYPTHNQQNTVIEEE